MKSVRSAQKAVVGHLLSKERARLPGTVAKA